MLLLVMAASVSAENVSVVYTNDIAVQSGHYVIVVLENDAYEFNFTISDYTGTGDITDGQVYTLADMDSLESYVRDKTTWAMYGYHAVTLMRDYNFVYHVTVDAGNGITYTISDGSTPEVTPDTTHIAMNSEDASQLYDHTDEGYFDIAGEDQANGYQFNLRVFSAQIAGNYTQNDVQMSEDILVHTDGTETENIAISEVRNFTVAADGNTYSTYIELVAEDGNIYGIDFRHDIIDALNAATEENVIVTTAGDNITIHSAEGEAISLYDAGGRLILNGRLTSDTHSIVLSHPGTYFLRIGTTTHTVIVR